MVELKSKLHSLLPQTRNQPSNRLDRGPNKSISQDAQDALVALGYKPGQAQQMISSYSNRKLANGRSRLRLNNWYPQP